MGGKEKHQQRTTQLFYALFLGNDLANTTKLYLTRDVSAYFHLTCLKSAISLLRKVKANRGGKGKSCQYVCFNDLFASRFFLKTHDKNQDPSHRPRKPSGRGRKQRDTEGSPRPGLRGASRGRLRVSGLPSAPGPGARRHLQGRSRRCPSGARRSEWPPLPGAPPTPRPP